MFDIHYVHVLGVHVRRSLPPTEATASVVWVRCVPGCGFDPLADGATVRHVTELAGFCQRCQRCTSFHVSGGIASPTRKQAVGRWHTLDMSSAQLSQGFCQFQDAEGFAAWL